MRYLPFICFLILSSFVFKAEARIRLRVCQGGDEVSVTITGKNQNDVQTKLTQLCKGQVGRSLISPITEQDGNTIFWTIPGDLYKENGICCMGEYVPAK
jgi:hypothetical protein